MQSTAKGVSVRWVMRLSVGLLSGLLLAMVIWQIVIIYWPQQQQAERLIIGNQAADHLASAIALFTTERDSGVAILAGEHRLSETRRQAALEGEHQLSLGLELLNALPSTQAAEDALGPLIQAINRHRETVAAYRASLQGGEPLDPDPWLQATTALVQSISDLRTHSLAQLGGDGMTVLVNLAIKNALLRAGENASLQRGALLLTMSNPDQPPLDSHQALADFREADRLIDALLFSDNRRDRANFNSLTPFLRPNDQAEVHASIQQARQTARTQFAETYLVNAQQAADALRDPDSATTYNTELWLSDSLEAFETLLALSRAVGLDAQARLADQQADSRWSLLTAGIMLIIGLLASLLAFWFLERLGSRIERLSHHMSTCAEKHDLTIRMTRGGGRELDLLAESFNYMMAQFDSIIADISQAASAAAVEIRRLTDTAQTLQQGAVSQDKDLEQLVTAMNEMASTVEQVADNTAQAAQSAQAADSTAARGNQTVIETTLVIAELNQQRGHMMKVIEVITEIARQTNLLSLNASVEAARAGQHGKGFAVVAQEIQQLAHRTRQATGEVKAMLERFERHASEAMDAMSGDNDGSRTSASHALQQIVEAVASIHSMNDEVATAARQQALVAADMNQRLASIADVSQETSRSAQASTTAISRVNDSLGALNRQAERFIVRTRRDND